MKVRAALFVLLLAAGCGRTEPFRFAELLPDGGTRPDDETRDCPNEVQSFTLPPVPGRRIDMLFVVDDSGSMGDDQATLAANFRALMSEFRAQDVAFHVGAITTDMTATNRSGRFIAPFLTPATPDIDGAFRSMVVVGSSGSADERGLDAARAALSDPLATGANRDFLRPDADLALVWLTDEPDHSRVSAADFTDFLRSLKTEPQKISVISILGLRWYFMCERLTAGWAYATVARSFGSNGMVVNCTSDYARRMAEIGKRIVNARCMVELKHPIDRGQPRVTVNGAPAQWVYYEPDLTHPNGTLEVSPCPPSGEVVVVEPNCP